MKKKTAKKVKIINKFNGKPTNKKNTHQDFFTKIIKQLAVKFADTHRITLLVRSETAGENNYFISSEDDPKIAAMEIASRPCL